jgi:hypothetical protein
MNLAGLRICTVAVLTAGLAALAGCGGGDDDRTPFTPVAGSDSAYCRAYRSWKVYELDAGGAYDQHNPAALRTWWNAYLVAEETMLRQAPPEIRGEVAIKVGRIRTQLTPLLEKYGFDLKRLRREGSPAEQDVLFGPPPAEVDRAQEAQYAYEDETCGTAPTPRAADVVFEADASANPYCGALRAFNTEVGKVSDSRFDREVLRRFVTGDRFSEILDGLDDAAPAEIAEDVLADTEWFRTRWSDVVAEYEYDLRAIYLRSTPEDLAVFNRTHPDVIGHTARTTAYEEQVCEG